MVDATKPNYQQRNDLHASIIQRKKRNLQARKTILQIFFKRNKTYTKTFVRYDSVSFSIERISVCKIQL